MVIDFYLMMDLRNAHISILPLLSLPGTTRNIFRVPKKQQQSRKKLEIWEKRRLKLNSVVVLYGHLHCMLHDTMAKLINIGLCRH